MSKNAATKMSTAKTSTAKASAPKTRLKAPQPIDRRAIKRHASTNKQGQALGPKGESTRRRLIDATELLLKTHSPVDLTAVAIAKFAETSSATFYMYFDDIREILYALSDLATQDLAEILHVLEEDWNQEALDEHADKLVEAFYAVWDRHREVLRYRNMESDRGDPEFDQLRQQGAFPFIEALATQIIIACPHGKGPSRGDARALATVLNAALERLAAIDTEIVQSMLGMSRIKAAQARVISAVFRSVREGHEPLPRDIQK